MPKQPSDIRPLGAAQGVGYYWIQELGQVGACLRLVAINELGEVTRTSLGGKWSEAALTEHEAITRHLGAGIAQADAELSKREADAPEPAEPPPAMDRPTRRFFKDGE